MSYAIDERDDIARSWPESINDTYAYEDWGWKARFDLDQLVEDMLSNIKIADPL